MINEGATQEVIRMILDVKGNTLTEPASTRVVNFGFSFTCIDSSNGGGPQAVSELWMYVGRDTRCSVVRLTAFKHVKPASFSIPVYL